MQNGGQEGPLSVVVIDRDSMSRSTIKSLVTQFGGKVTGETESVSSGLSLVNGLRPQMLVLELPQAADATLDAVRALKNEHPDMGIVITASDSSPQLILRCMRAGAQEFLTRPVNVRELGEATKRITSMVRRPAAGRKQNGRIITVFSSKGGVGVTSVATNLAVSYAKNAGKRTVIVDLNLQMGDVGLLLDLRPEYTLADAMGGGNLDASRLKGLLTAHASGVQLLTTPEDPVESEKISPGLLVEVMSLLKGLYDVIIVDAGHFFDSRVLEVLTLADTILVVSVLDVPTVRNVRRCLTLFDQLGYGRDKVRLIVNRHQKRTKVTVEDLEETAEARVFWEIPNDYKTLIASIDAGVPAVEQSPRSKFSRSLEDLTRELVRLHGQDAVLPEPAETEATAETRSASR